MLVFAFDASGDDSTPYLTVAGFVSSAADWDKFAAVWSARLKQDNIEFFHAADLDNFWGPFRHWQGRQDRKTLRENLCADLMKILKSHVYQKFGSTVINNAFQKMDANLRKEFALCAYSAAGRTCEKQVREYVATHFTRGTEFAVVFEAGDKGKGKLQKRIAEDSGLDVKFLPKKDAIPLQAADWLAYELNKAVGKFGQGTLESESQLRWPMREFLTYPPGPIGVYTSDDIREMEKNVEAAKQRMGLGESNSTTI
jgi:hypothetical protein